MKKICIILAAIVSTTLLSTNSFAVNPDATGSISGNYLYGDTNISGATASLYQVATLEQSGSFTYADAFAANTTDLATLSNSELGEYAKALANLAQKDDARASATIAEDGYAFDDLPLGLYLITFDDYQTGDYTYSAAPIILSLPGFDETTNTEDYQLVLNTKVSREQIPTTVSTPASPRTHDDVIKYFVIAGICLALLCLSLYVLKREKAKKGEK